MPKLTRTTHAYYEHFLSKVEEERSQPYTEADIERILADLQSEDETTRARAVREICPCRMSWEVFHRLRKAAKPLQKDPSPLVRTNAHHIEQDARMVASFEAQIERERDYKEAVEAEPRDQGRRQIRQRRRHHVRH